MGLIDAAFLQENGKVGLRVERPDAAAGVCCAEEAADFAGVAAKGIFRAIVMEIGVSVRVGMEARFARLVGIGVFQEAAKGGADLEIEGEVVRFGDCLGRALLGRERRFMRADFGGGLLHIGVARVDDPDDERGKGEHEEAAASVALAFDDDDFVSHDFKPFEVYTF